MSSAKPKAFVLKRHANAAAHKLLMRELKQMTPAELFLSAVEVGIYSRDGSLKAPYAEPARRQAPKRAAKKKTA